MSPTRIPAQLPAISLLPEMLRKLLPSGVKLHIRWAVRVVEEITTPRRVGSEASAPARDAASKSGVELCLFGRVRVREKSEPNFVCGL